MDSEPYQPPQMPPFPTSLAELYPIFASYYQEERPLDLFFEFFVVDVLGLLPLETRDALADLLEKHPTLLPESNGDWVDHVRKTLHLSDTIEVAIFDLWYTNRRTAREQGWDYHPWHYAQDFAENFFAEDSRVDVWEGDALLQAQRRVDLERNARAN